MKGIKIREVFTITEATQSAPQKQVLSVTESAKNDKLPKSITTVVEAIHPGMTKNKVFYPGNRLSQHLDSWTYPYNKPVLKHHNDYNGEPLGRVRSAWYVQSVLKAGSECVKLELEILDPDAIEKVLDGRYQTLSIGCTVYSLFCSVCNKDIIAEGFCGHWKGNKYDGKECHWTVGELEFDEISFVNTPADSSAQVLIPNAAQTTEGRGDAMDVDSEGRVIESADSQDILDQIDALRTRTESDESPTPPEETTEEASDEEEVEETPEEPAPAEETEEPETTTEEKLAALEAQVKELQEAIVEKDATIANLEHKLQQADEKIGQLETENAQLTDALAASQSEASHQLKLNVDLATNQHRLLAEKVVDIQIVLGEIKAEEKDSALAKLAKEKASALNLKANELVKKRAQRLIQQVANPGLGVNSPGDEETTKTSSTPRTADDAVKEMLDAMYPHMRKTGGK